MGVGAVVQDGKIQESKSAQSIANSRNTKNSNYDKDTFLHLLVAEVQNQDPLEPTTNTEWVSQYATFSELEQMQNMNKALTNSQALSLVGQNVILQTEDEKGDIKVVSGSVDFVTIKDGNAFLSVEGTLYSMDDLVSIVDKSYAGDPINESEGDEN